MVERKQDELLQEVWDEIAVILGDELAELTVERIVIGIFFTGVKLSNGFGGISYTPVKTIPEAVCCPSAARKLPASGRLRGEKAVRLLEDLHSGIPIRKTVAIAVLNALSAACWERSPPEDYAIYRGFDAIDGIELADDDHVVVVGALEPYLKRLKARGKPFVVLEMDTAALKDDELPFYRHADDWPEVIPQADVLIVTGTTLINDTVQHLLARARPEATVIIVGPTSSLLPTPFFARGVHTIGGVLAHDPDTLLNLIAEGGSGYHFFRDAVDKIVLRSRRHA